MADTVTTNVLHNGTRRYIAQFLNQSDGTGETNVVKIDASTLTGPNGEAPSKVSIQSVEWDIQGISAVKVAFDATTDGTALFLNEGNGYKDLCSAGGLHDPQSLGSTGDILFTTIGAASNGTYDIIMHVKLHD